MLCCTKCFRDFYIKKKINRFGLKGDCDFCKEKNSLCIDTTKLSPYIQPLFDLYIPFTDARFTTRQIAEKSKHLWEHLNDDFNLFNHGCDHKNLTIQLLRGACDEEEAQIKVSKRVAFADGSVDKAYQDRINIWEQQSEEMTYKNRFFFTKRIPFHRLEELLNFLSLNLKKGSIFYRARISNDRKKIIPKNMGAPPPKKATDGRANPSGIPYLYLSSTHKATIYEVKPTIKDYVCVGKFALKSDLQCIDLREISPMQFYRAEDYENAFKYIGLLNKIGESLTVSVNHRVAHLEYLPTQYFCEFIKKCSYKGILYNSSSSLGYNLIVFADDNAKCRQVKCYEISKVQYTDELP